MYVKAVKGTVMMPACECSQQNRNALALNKGSFF